MQSRFIPYNNSSIHYCVYGSGDKLVFCFHGYGEQAESFAFLESSLGKTHTLIAIDMPFHGETQWLEGLSFTPAQLVAIIRSIQAVTPAFNKPDFSLLGYSMGGRVALHLLQELPERIARAVLVAPDGLHKNFWYRFSTQTSIGKKVFRRAMYKPQRVFWLLKKAAQFKLMHQSIIKVAHYYLDDADERIKLYQRWTTMHAFKPSLPKLKKLVAQHHVPVRFLFGKYDNIILSTHSNFFKDDTQNIKVEVIEAGHRLLQEKHAAAIAGLFNS